MTPPRLFRTTAPLFDGPDGHETETGTVPFACDLDAVYAVRGSDEFPARCVVHLPDGRCLVDAPFDAVFAAWEAYRRHADAPHTFTRS